MKLQRLEFLRRSVFGSHNVSNVCNARKLNGKMFEGIEAFRRAVPHLMAFASVNDAIPPKHEAKKTT